MQSTLACVITYTHTHTHTHIYNAYGDWQGTTYSRVGLCLAVDASPSLLVSTVGCLFLRATNFVDFMDFWYFHENFYQKLAEIIL